MLPRLRRTFFSLLTQACLIAAIFLLLSSFKVLAGQSRNNIICREEVPQARREQLAMKLRKITGWADLQFDSNGVMRFTEDAIDGGSASARQLFLAAVGGSNVVIIEEASNSSDVAFCRVIPGRWKENAEGRPPVFVVQIDFADFDQLGGDERARDAFNVGWGFLHELDHIVNDSLDATSLGYTGECEAHINEMRRECHVPERTDYFSTLAPLATDATFATRLVRLAFEEQTTTARKKRYWLIWDAKVVGGLEATQIAALR
jgi:hypothetical protein